MAVRKHQPPGGYKYQYFARVAAKDEQLMSIYKTAKRKMETYKTTKEKTGFVGPHSFGSSN